LIELTFSQMTGSTFIRMNCDVLETGGLELSTSLAG